MTEIAQLTARVDIMTGVLRDLANQLRASEKPMTISAFAERVGCSRSTIQRRINERFILTKGGRIPPSELKKFGL